MRQVSQSIERDLDEADRIILLSLGEPGDRGLVGADLVQPWVVDLSRPPAAWDDWEKSVW